MTGQRTPFSFFPEVLAMTCVGPKNQNQFSILASLDASPPNELSRVQRNPCGKDTPRDPAIKLQRHADQRCNPQQPCNPVSRQYKNGYNQPRPANVRTSLSSLQSPHAHIGSRHEIGITLFVKTKDPTVTPPRHYLPYFKRNQSSLEWHHRDSVTRRLGEPFRTLVTKQLC